ncbi:MAG: hypothetical protein ACI9JL_000499 [Paracoccaceae bacterium]|jgi:hypothetical protein
MSSLTGVLISALVLMSGGAQATLIGDSVQASMTGLNGSSVATQFPSPQIVVDLPPPNTGGNVEFSGVWQSFPGSTIGVRLDVLADGFRVSGFQTTGSFSRFSSFPIFRIDLSDLDWLGTPASIIGLNDLGGSSFDVISAGFTSNSAFVEFRGISIRGIRTFSFDIEETQIPEPGTPAILVLGLAGIGYARLIRICRARQPGEAV